MDKSKDDLIKDLQDEIKELKYEIEANRKDPLIICVHYEMYNKSIKNSIFVELYKHKDKKICITCWNPYAPLKNPTNLLKFKIIDIPIIDYGSKNHNCIDCFYTKWNIEHLILNNIYLGYDDPSFEDIHINILEIIFPDELKYNFGINATIDTLILRSDIKIFNSLKTGLTKILKEIIIYDCPKLKANLKLQSWCKENKIRIEYL